jgi:uncharacterized protein with FMN-binding domain
MDILLNLGLAWVSVAAMSILSLKYVTKRLWVKDVKNKTKRGINTTFRKIHNYLGMILIATGLIHGLNSSVNVFSLNYGTILFIFSLLAGLNYLLRKRIKPWLVYHNAITTIMISLLVIHIVDVGGIRIIRVLFPPNQEQVDDNNNTTDDDITDDDNTDNNANTSTNNFGTNVILKDGTFTGSGTGYSGLITVSTTIKDNNVTNISTTSIRDDYKYYSRAQSYIFPYVVNNQTIDVDTVSGATYSSRGFINAIKNSLNSALSSGTIQ